MDKLYSKLFASDSLQEYEEGTKLIKNSFPLISVLGGSRIASDSSEYRFAFDLCKRLSTNGYNIITGGGPGIMEAANKGAILGGGLSYGFNLKDLDEDNPYISLGLGKKFQNPSVRKAIIIENSIAFLFFPGGFGTYDELFEIAALIQTKRIPPSPVFLIGQRFWSSFLSWFEDIITQDYADRGIMKTFTLTENVSTIIEEIQKIS